MTYLEYCLQRSLAVGFLICCILPTTFAVSAQLHGIALQGNPKYGQNFQYFDYVNPDAPKGGEARFAAIGSFDTFNPFNIKGQVATDIGRLFETRLISSADEPFSEYGLIAESLEVPDSRNWVIFNLRSHARFHDGSPVTADDVLFSFEILKEKGNPIYQIYYANVSKVEKLNERQVKFIFSSGGSRELPLTLGQMPILSKKYWANRDFETTTLDIPIGSGPYKVESFEPGRFIIFKRDEHYWGSDLPVNRGLNNIDRLRYDYYRDATVALEAFKSGSYDLRVENVAKQWATGYHFPAPTRCLLKQEVFRNQLPSGMQGFAYNLRRSLFKDKRVRQALTYAFDFDWSNRNLFFSQYTRTRSYFDNSELAAHGQPSADELAVLEPLRNELPPEVFTAAYTPPTAIDNHELRTNLQKALKLLQEADWVFRDRKLVNARTLEPFRFELLITEPIWERIALPFARNLERLGIEMKVRLVDPAQYINRERSLDFDMIVGSWAQSLSPGNEQRDFWSSASADRIGSRNIVGLKNPAVDYLVDLVSTAPDRMSLITRVRALDRALQWSYLVIPHWYFPGTRIAFWDKFGYPKVVPTQGVQLDTWWIDPTKDKLLRQKECHPTQ
jgi:microcin C transport system substrate-binding protein